MKFCFWGEVGSALKGKTIGGSELQIALLARSLAKEGHEVIIIDPFSDESFASEEGVKVVYVPEWKKGWPVLRLLTHRLPALYKLLVQQKADYYYVRMRAYFHYLSYRAAKKTGGKFIINIASDLDLSGFRKRFKEYRSNFNLLKFLFEKLPNDLVFDYLLRKADFIALQHGGQKIRRAIKGKIGIFPNIFDFSSLPLVENPSKDYILKVGTFSVLKGSENFFRLVNMTDHGNKFVLVGSTREKKSRSSEIYKQLQMQNNLILKGRLDHAETLKCIAHAKAVISTSLHEGFPNIFLEAWAQGVPVISLNVNPGNVITDHKLGVFCGGDLNRMKECIEKNEISGLEKNTLISYVKKFHDFNTAGNRFIKFLNGSLQALIIMPLLFFYTGVQRAWYSVSEEIEVITEISRSCMVTGA